MAIDIAKFARMHEFELDTAALGRIRSGAYSVKAAAAVEKILGKEDLAGPAFARLLLQQVGTLVPEDEKPEDGETASAASLTADQVDSLSDEEVEEFAREFLAHNSYLVKLHDEPADKKSDSPGRAQPAALKKEPDESDSEFLLRVVRGYNKIQSARLGKLMEPYKSLWGKPLFSDPTQELLRRNFALSDRLEESLAGFRRASGGIGTESPYPEQLTLPPENPAYETNRRLAGLLDYADRLEPVVLESGELIRNLSHAAIQILADFGRSTRRAERFNKIIITIAALSLIVTAVFSVWSFLDARERSSHAREAAASQQTQTDALIAAQNERMEKLLQAFREQAQARGAEQREAFAALIESLSTDTARADGQRSEEQAYLRKLIQSLTQAVEKLQQRSEPQPRQGSPQ